LEQRRWRKGRGLLHGAGLRDDSRRQDIGNGGKQ
jgi:hypothetical protein